MFRRAAGFDQQEPDLPWERRAFSTIWDDIELAGPSVIVRSRSSMSSSRRDEKNRRYPGAVPGELALDPTTIRSWPLNVRSCAATSIAKQRELLGEVHPILHHRPPAPDALAGVHEVEAFLISSS